jgi:hypothetical protein
MSWQQWVMEQALFMDEAPSPVIGSLGQKPCQLFGFAPFRLCL